MKTGILWDLDGTLLDTLQDLRSGVNHAMAQFGYPARTLEEVRRFVGNGARRLLEQSAPAGADVDAIVKVFHAYYDVNCIGETRPYPGIPEALAELGEKYPMAIVSNKPHSAVTPLCDKYFSGMYARGEQPGCPRKPAPDMVYAAMKELGVETCVYVGDSEVDVLTAQNAGVPCLTVLWGFRDREDLEKVGATHFCEKPEDLPRTIAELTGE
ncbi:MAG: HAD-IA family hydrolase [Oscillospiraceae bacterium]|nr:HAD-IA family hydrolase [Oscillospiraceae bacterium]